AKRGCLLVQLPPSLRRDRQEEFEGLLEYLADDAAGWHFAVEFRHLSWYDSAVYRMLRSHRVGTVLHDLPASATPAIDIAGDFAYLRFHGPEGGYRGSYDDRYLQTQADRISGWLQAGKEVYAYFNNTLGDALQNLRTLNSLLGR
ncbi:MAG: DUF72 domain-containing protein, partial [Chitinophagaceae bacterium]